MIRPLITRFPFQWPRPASIAWEGDVLVDWVGGGKGWLSDGTAKPRDRFYGGSFDRALISPSGRFSAVYAERQTKALILERGELLREIDRSYYRADSFAYPIALGRLPDGREVLAHCPKEYNVIEIEDLATGRRLTPRRGKAEDIFHSRLSFSPDGRHLLSAGWFWHPWNAVCIFDVALALDNPRSLDRLNGEMTLLHNSVSEREARSACWLDSDRLLVTTDTWDLEDEDEGEDGEPDDTALPKGSSGIWSVSNNAWLSRETDWNPQGSLQACGGGALYVEDGCPHWWLPGGGAPLRWPDITVLQPDEPERHGIVFDSPLLAAHPTERRFAAVTETGIVIVELG